MGGIVHRNTKVPLRIDERRDVVEQVQQFVREDQGRDLCLESIEESITRTLKKAELRTVRELLTIALAAFSIMVLFGKLPTSVAVSCELPPTRMRTPPARSATVASRLRNGTWTKELRMTLSLFGFLSKSYERNSRVFPN